MICPSGHRYRPSLRRLRSHVRRLMLDRSPSTRETRNMIFQIHPRCCSRRQRTVRPWGFTLVELMVVIAIVAILASLAAPSWQAMIVRNNIRTAVNDLAGSLQFARSEAVRLNSAITVCASTDAITCANTGFENGWIVRTGAQTNDPDNQQLLQDTLPRQFVRIASVRPAFPIFTFLPNGLPAGGFNGVTISVCPADPSMNSLTRNMVINRPGRIRIEQPGNCPL